MRRVAWLLLGAVTAAGILLLFVFPGRTLLAQNRDVATAEQHITALDRENAALRQERRQLTDPAMIVQIARGRFGLVTKGQSEYDITDRSGTAGAAPAPVVHRPVAHHDLWRDLELWR